MRDPCMRYYARPAPPGHRFGGCFRDETNRDINEIKRDITRKQAGGTEGPVETSSEDAT